MASQVRINLLGLNRTEMEAFFLSLGEKAFRAAQVLKWIHQHGLDDFAAMTDLSKRLREHLKAVAVIEAPAIVIDQTGRDHTRKWLLRVDSGNCVEMVFIPEEERGTLCVSSQVGCALNCSFCSTGHQGYNRNLSAAEIIGQVWLARRMLSASPRNWHTLTNVVLMGMGEPLLNFENVLRAIDVMRDDLAYGLSRRRVTLSTAGVVPAIDRLAARSDVSLAVSLHAPNDPLRNELVPLNRKYPIDELLAACRRYVAGKPRSRVTFEYVMLAGINDSEHHARQLAALLLGVPAKVNLIPFNPFPHMRYRRSGPEVIDRFRAILLAAGIMTITRKTRGDDIDAACGQLVGKVQDRTRRSRHESVQTARVVA